MEALKCYTLNGNKVVSGIKVADFESIMTTDPSTTMIKQAVLQTMPVVGSGTMTRTKSDFQNLTSLSLNFIHEVTGKATIAKSCCLLAVDPNIWRVGVDNIPAALIDPCGLTGYIILFLRADSPNMLSLWDSPDTVLSVNKTGVPEVHKVNRASRMLMAVTSSKKLISAPAQSQVAPAP